MQNAARTESKVDPRSSCIIGECTANAQLFRDAEYLENHWKMYVFFILTMPHIDTLPIEIYESIFTHVSLDHRSLRSCLYIHRSWLPHIQPYFFQRLVIGRSYDEEDIIDDIAMCHRLLNILIRSPRLALHFCHVELRLPLEAPYNLINESEALIQLLPRLSQVRSLTLESISQDSAHHFSELPPSLLVAITQLISSTVFATLEIREWCFQPGVRNFIQLIQHCAGSLRSLSLFNVTFTDPTPQKLSSVDAALTPQMPLELSHLEEFRVWPQDAYPQFQVFTMPNLQKIWWPLTDGSYSPLVIALRGIPGLQSEWTFGIHGDVSDDQISRILLCERFAALRHLTLAFWCYGGNTTAIHAIDSLASIIPISQIETFTARFITHLGSLWEDLQWTRLTAVLVPFVKALKAKKVSLVFSVGLYLDTTDFYKIDEETGDEMNFCDLAYQTREKIDQVREMMEARFIDLRSKGVLSISKEYTVDMIKW